MVLYLSHTKYYNLKFRVGVGTNTRIELLALSSLLYFANSIEVQNLQIVGDSKLFVDWFNHKCKLQVLNLERW